MDPFRVRIPLQIHPFECGEGRVHSLNHQVCQRLFKVTTPHYKHLLSRQEAMKPGGPDGKVLRPRGQRTGLGAERPRELFPHQHCLAQNKQLWKTAWNPRDLFGMGVYAQETPFDGKMWQQKACPLLFGSQSPAPYAGCFINGCVNKFRACYFSCAQWGRKKCHSIVIPNWALFKNDQMLFLGSAYIFDFLPLIFVWLVLRWGLGALERLREVSLRWSLSQHLRGLPAAALNLLSAALAAAAARTNYFPSRSREPWGCKSMQAGHGTDLTDHSALPQAENREPDAMWRLCRERSLWETTTHLWPQPVTCLCWRNLWPYLTGRGYTHRNKPCVPFPLLKIRFSTKAAPRVLQWMTEDRQTDRCPFQNYGQAQERYSEGTVIHSDITYRLQESIQPSTSSDT